MSKRVSVIVPVYNIENYINRCIDSLLLQSYDNFEIIAIDDGSTDNSGTILDSYKNIKVIHTENKGLSAARNLGIESAESEYIMFVDGDDYVASNYISRMVETIKDNDAAICAFTNNGQRITFMESSSTGKELLLNALKSDGYKYIIAMNKIYKKSLFENLRFKEGYLFEDEFINYRLFYNIDKIAYTNDILYFYGLRDGSITNTSLTPLKLAMQKEMHIDRIAFYKERDKRLYLRAIQMYLNWMLRYEMYDDFKKYSLKTLFSDDVLFLEKAGDIIGLISPKTASKIKKLFK